MKASYRSHAPLYLLLLLLTAGWSQRKAVLGANVVEGASDEDPQGSIGREPVAAAFPAKEDQAGAERPRDLAAANGSGPVLEGTVTEPYREEPPGTPSGDSLAQGGVDGLLELRKRQQRLRNQRRAENFRETLRRLAEEGPSSRRKLLRTSGDERIDIARAIVDETRRKLQSSSSDDLEILDIEFTLVTALSPGLAEGKRRPEDDDDFFCAGIKEGAPNNVFIINRPVNLVLRSCQAADYDDIAWTVPDLDSDSENSRDDVLNTGDEPNVQDHLPPVPNQYPPYIVALRSRNVEQHVDGADREGNIIYVKYYDWWMYVDKVANNEPITADRRSIYDLEPTYPLDGSDFVKWYFLRGPYLDSTWRVDLEEEGYGGYKQRYCAAVKGGRARNRRRLGGGKKKKKRKKKKGGGGGGGGGGRNGRRLEGKKIVLETCAEKSSGNKRRRQAWIFCGASAFCDIDVVDPPPFVIEVSVAGQSVRDYNGRVRTGVQDDARLGNSPNDCAFNDDNLYDQLEIGTWWISFTSATLGIPAGQTTTEVSVTITSRCGEGGGNNDVLDPSIVGADTLNDANFFNLQTVFQLFVRDENDNRFECLTSDFTDCWTGNDPTRGVDQDYFNDNFNRFSKGTVTFQNVNIRRGATYIFRARGATQARECGEGSFQCIY